MQTQEFADRMRLAVLKRMPILSERIHRSPEADDGEVLLPPPSPSPGSQEMAPGEEWSWPAAEKRLKDAFDKHGFSGWAAAALGELEAEGRMEREKRGHL